MKLSNFFIWLIGIGLIVFLSVLVSGYFDDQSILLLDTAVLMICWTLALYIYGGLFVSQEKFASEVPATGVKLYSLWAYCPLAFTCIYVGYAYKIPFKWQLFIHICFLFLFIIGIIVSNASVERLNVVASKSQVRHTSKDNLLAMAQQMKLAASLNKTIDSEVQKEIAKFAERVSYISPSDSPAAMMQEDMLKSCIGHLASLVQSNAPIEQLLKELEDAKTILSQRIKTY